MTPVEGLTRTIARETGPPGLHEPGRDHLGRAGEDVRTLMATGVETLGQGVGHTPGNRRDPFRRWMEEIGKEIETGPRLPRSEEARLVGIMKGSGGERVAVFVDGASETGYFMRERMSFRDGGLHEIDAGSGVVTVRRWTGQFPPIGGRFTDIRLHPLEQETQ